MTETKTRKTKAIAPSGNGRGVFSKKMTYKDVINKHISGQALAGSIVQVNFTPRVDATMKATYRGIASILDETPTSIFYTLMVDYLILIKDSAMVKGSKKDYKTVIEFIQNRSNTIHRSFDMFGLVSHLKCDSEFKSSEYEFDGRGTLAEEVNFDDVIKEHITDNAMLPNGLFPQENQSCKIDPLIKDFMFSVAHTSGVTPTDMFHSMNIDYLRLIMQSNRFKGHKKQLKNIVEFVERRSDTTERVRNIFDLL